MLLVENYTATAHISKILGCPTLRHTNSMCLKLNLIITVFYPTATGLNHVHTSLVSCSARKTYLPRKQCSILKISLPYTVSQSLFLNLCHHVELPKWFSTERMKSGFPLSSSFVTLTVNKKDVFLPVIVCSFLCGYME